MTYPLLNRIDILLPIEDLLQIVVRDYRLGRVLDFLYFEKGYEDLNVKLVTASGIYVVKIFNINRSYGRPQYYVKGLVEFTKINVRVPKLFEHNGEYLYSTPGKKTNTFLCVMEYFEGNNFTEIKATENDLINICKFIALINTCKFPVVQGYDSWGTANLVTEFKKKKQFIEPEDIELILPVLKDFSKIDFSSFSQSVIHGDVQRAHVLKNAQGKYCIIDLGCMNVDASILDLAIFLAHFTIDIESLDEVNQLMRLIVHEYNKVHPLPEIELKCLPLLMQSTYAIYLIASSAQITGKNNPSAESLDWQTFGRKGLLKMKKFNTI